MHRNDRALILGLLMLSLSACGGGGGGGAASSPSPTSAPTPTPTPTPTPSPSACTPVPDSTQPKDSLAGIVDAAAIAELRAQRLPGLTVAVAKKGTILYAQAYGYADLATCRAMKISDPMQIGSVTKQFTASATLQLQEKGLIDLDHSVASYLPQYSFDPRITVRMLLNQTSGLPEYTEFASLQPYALTGGPESVGLTEMAKAFLMFEPGTYHYYSNTNYFILGSIIEAVSSQSYADYLSTNLFAPAGLTHTSYTQPSDAASPYGSKAGGGDYAGIVLPPSVYFSAGTLWSNVEDLALWDDAWLSGKIVSQASIDLMQTPAKVPYFKDGPPSDYGMGWITHAPISGHPFIWHNGGTTSYTTFNGLVTDNGLSLTVLTNYTLTENGPGFLRFGEQIIGTICDTAAIGAC